MSKSYLLVIILCFSLLYPIGTGFSQKNDLSLDLTKTTYHTGGTIVISGKVSPILEKTPIIIQIFYSKQLITIAQVDVAKDGSFIYVEAANNHHWQNSGKYLVRTTYGQDNIKEAYFDFIADQAENTKNNPNAKPSQSKNLQPKSYAEYLEQQFHPKQDMLLRQPAPTPQPEILDIPGNRFFKLYRHEFFTIMIPAHWQIHQSHTNIGNQLDNYSLYAKDNSYNSTEYHSLKQAQSISVSFRSYFEYQNRVDLTKDSTFDAKYIYDGLKTTPYSQLTLDMINEIAHNCYYSKSYDTGCQNLLINQIRFIAINDMPAIQIEYEYDSKPPRPYDPNSYLHDEQLDKKLRIWEQVSALDTKILTKGFFVNIYTKSTAEDYLDNPVLWDELVLATNSFDTINDVHKITDGAILEQINMEIQKFEEKSVSKIMQLDSLNQDDIPTSNMMNTENVQNLQASQLDSTNNKIPDWVKNVFEYWIDGKISEEELKNAIRFLINSKIIVL